MPHNTTHDYLICYDISDPKRLIRVYRTLTRQAIAVQYSVFLFTGTANALTQCLQELAQLIAPRKDDVRAYPLPTRGQRLLLGQPPLPQGIHWAGLPYPWGQSQPPPGASQTKNQTAAEHDHSQHPAAAPTPWAMALVPAHSTPEQKHVQHPPNTHPQHPT